MASVRKRGFLTKGNLHVVGLWKAARSARYLDRNKEAYVRDVTAIAFLEKSEQLRIEVLTLLHGVGWPTASVLLHWFHEDDYPILDFRALWSLSVDKPPSDYWFDFWSAYVKKCRSLAKQYNVDMRTLDRALWQYSKENQPPSRSGGPPK